MKAIFNGLRYDTEKAMLVGESCSSSLSVYDFGHWEAKLYKTPRSGRFFLAGTGGPMTRWARPMGNNGQTGGSGIIPMNEEDAREWAEQYLSAAEIEAGFAVEDA